MADNQYVNKVDWNGGTLIDLTTDDVSRADVALGKTFHLPSGEQTTGTSAGAGGAYNIVSTIDENDKQHLAITDAQGGTTIEPLSVTSNGTYEESGKAYSPVVVNVPASTVNYVDATVTGNSTQITFSGVGTLTDNFVLVGLTTAMSYMWGSRYYTNSTSSFGTITAYESSAASLPSFNKSNYWAVSVTDGVVNRSQWGKAYNAYFNGTYRLYYW